jgi:hypothetical protein
MQHRKSNISNRARCLSDLAVTELYIKLTAVLFSEYPIPFQDRGSATAQAAIIWLHTTEAWV